MHCSRCEVPHYPRLSPSMIVLVTRGDELLLARSPRFVSGVYSTLAGFVEPYAPDVVLEGPFGTYQGRKMAVDWARSLQDWNAPYSETDRRIRVERIVSKNQDARDVFYTMHEFRWEESGSPVRQTFSTMWRNHDGQWLIAHERISDVKPVTGERIEW